MKKAETQEFLPLLFALGFAAPVAVFASSVTDSLSTTDNHSAAGTSPTTDKPTVTDEDTKSKDTSNQDNSDSDTADATPTTSCRKKTATKKSSSTKTKKASTGAVAQPQTADLSLSTEPSVTTVEATMSTTDQTGAANQPAISAPSQERSQEQLAEQPQVETLAPAYDGPYPFNPHAIATSDDLFLALEEPDVIELTLANDIFVNQDVEIDHDLTINLNHYHIISFQEGAHVLDVKSGITHLKGVGQVHAMGNNSTAVRIKGATSSQANYATVIIDSGIKLYAPHYYGIYIAPNFDAAYGVTVDFAGQMTSRDGIFLHGNIRGRDENLPLINIQDGAIIEVDETVGIAVQADGHGIWQIGAASLTGATGLKIKSGKFTLTHTQVMALGVPLGEHGWSNDIYGVGAALQIESNNEFAKEHGSNEHAGDILIKISGDQGKYQSAESYVFAEYGAESEQANLEKLEIIDGEFAGRLGVFYGLISEAANDAVQVKGGKFSTEISRYLASDYYLYLEKDDLGRYVVQGNTAIDEDVDEEQQKLNVALAKLINSVAQAEHFVAPEYYAGNFGSLQKTIEKTVKRINKTLKKPYDILAHQNEAELSDVANEITNLEQAINEMQEVEHILRAELAEMADEATCNRHRYTRDSYADLAEVVKRSEELLGREELNLSDIDAMLGEIDAAKMLLEERSADDFEDDDLLDDLPVVPIEDLLPKTKTLADAKAELSNLLVEIDSLSVLDYTSDSLAILLELAMGAEQILRDEVDGLTIADLEEVIDSLNTARQSLEFAKHDEVLIARDTDLADDDAVDINDDFDIAEELDIADDTMPTEEFIDENVDEFATDEDFATDMTDLDNETSYESANDDALDTAVNEDYDTSAEDEARLLAIFEEADQSNEFDDVFEETDYQSDDLDTMEDEEYQADELDELEDEDFSATAEVTTVSEATNEDFTANNDSVTTSSANLPSSSDNAPTRLVNMTTSSENVTSNLSNITTNVPNVTMNIPDAASSALSAASSLANVSTNVADATLNSSNLPTQLTNTAINLSNEPKIPTISFPTTTHEFLEPVDELQQAKNSLQVLLDDARTLNPEDYTVESYAAFAEATSEASRLLQNNSMSVNADIISSLAEVVQSTRAGLVAAYTPADEARDNLITMLEAVQNLTVNDYFENTAEQFGELQVAISKAHAILAQPTAELFTIVAVMDEIKIATSGLKGGEETLRASLANLRQVISESERLLIEDFTDESYAEFQLVLERARRTLVIENPRFAEIDDMADELKLARTRLIVRPADWTVLQAQINAIAKLDRNDYLSTSFDVVIELLNRAKTLLTDPTTTQRAVDSLSAELNAAIQNLVLRPAHPTENLIMMSDNPTTPKWNLSNYNQAPTGYYTPRANGETAAPIPPNFLMSVMAGAYAGLAAYRRSRLDAKDRKQRVSRHANA